MNQPQKAEAFRALHEGEPFIVPNPWDPGSAKVMQALGFRALATTSSGFAFTLGRLDGEVELEELVAHVRALSDSTSIPLTVDLENGFGPEMEQVAESIKGVAQAGAVGASIEDYDPEGHIYEIGHAAERIAAAREAADGAGFPFTLTARAENHFRGNPDGDDTLADTIARLQAYERAGADVLYAPRLQTTDQIAAIAAATSKPLNVLAHAGLTLDEIVEAGGQRISVGGNLTWTAVAAMAEAAEAMLHDGDFSSMGAPVKLEEWLSYDPEVAEQDTGELDGVQSP